MLPLTEERIQASFVNASLRERRSIVPPNLTEVEWDKLSYLGWRDRRTPSIGYVVVNLDDAPVGILLRRADGIPRTRPQCSWCEDVFLPNDVVFFSVKRAGGAGRNGDTVGTLVCSEFECSANVRKRPATAYVGFDVEAARQQRIASLEAHVQNFVRKVRDGE
ncbi:FBP domain-containing protein [Okibacterium endophyticum]